MTKEQFLEKWNPISAIVKPLALAMEEANKADTSSENGINSHISGAPFNLMHEALLKIIKLQFGGPEYLHIEWGANGNFYDDVKAAVKEAFIKS